MKSFPFDEALKVLADVLERDGKKSRRAKKDRRALEHNAVRLSLRSAAQAYIWNKKNWGIGPAKVRNRYISMHKAAQNVREDIISMRREAVIIGPLISRVVKKLGRALGASLVWSESTAAGQVVPGSSDLLRPVEDGANS